MTDRADSRFRLLSETDDPALRDEIVRDHLPLARHVARRFVHRGESFDDLMQVASLALVKAVDRFDPDQGTQFSTFAVPTLMGELKRHFRDRGWGIRVPRRLQELHGELTTLTSSLSQTLGRAPTTRELADAAHVDSEDVLEALDAGASYRSVSLDAPLGDGAADGMSVGEGIADEEAGFDDIERRLDLEPLLESLPERQRTILVYRFGDGMTQAEIGEKIGVSQMHVSRLLNQALRDLRDRVGDGPGS